MVCRIILSHFSVQIILSKVFSEQHRNSTREICVCGILCCQTEVKQKEKFCTKSHQRGRICLSEVFLFIYGLTIIETIFSNQYLYITMTQTTVFGATSDPFSSKESFSLFCSVVLFLFSQFFFSIDSFCSHQSCFYQQRAAVFRAKSFINPLYLSSNK